MKLLYKIFLFGMLLVLLSLVLPALFFLLPTWTSLAMIVILFFLIVPVFSAFVGALVATDIKRLFWMPLAQLAIFPLLFFIASRQFMWEMYIYSLIYLFISLISFAIAYAIKMLKKWEASC